MKPSQCVYSTQRALYRVFVRPSASRPTQLHFASWRLATASSQQARSYATRRKSRSDLQPPSPSELVAQDEKRKHDPRFTTAADIQRSGRSRLPQDHEITDPQIMVHERDTIEGPLRTNFVMTRIESHESLRMVTPYVPATADSPEKFAVCRIVDKKAAYEKEKQSKAKKQAKKQNATKEKELEVNWGIDQNDLQTKLGTLTRLLEGPAKVTVRFGKKKTSKAAVARADMDALVKKVRDEIASLGGREYKVAEGSLGQTMMLHFASKTAT